MTEELTESQYPPFFTELIGEPATGKTHLAMLYSNPVLADLTLRGKSKVIVQKLYPEDWEDRYFRIKSFDDLRKALKKAHEDERDTLIIETGSDLRLMGGEEFLKELQKKKSERQTLHPTEWKAVNTWFNEIVNKAIEDYKMNLVLTAEMRDEWKSNKATGRRERSGFPRMDFYADLRLYLKVESKVTGVNPEVVEKKRIAIVAKNGFKDQTSSEWVGKIELTHEDPPTGETFEMIRGLIEC